ncbi:MAG TPA: hypothetical protein VGC99_14000, partial [Candidatus Tectomicrobia bacterium]
RTPTRQWQSPQTGAVIGLELRQVSRWALLRLEPEGTYTILKQKDACASGDEKAMPMRQKLSKARRRDGRTYAG